MINLYLILYIILFIGTYFNSFVFPNMSNDSRIITIILIFLFITILEKLSSDYLIENFLSNEALQNLNSVYNKDNMIVSNLTVDSLNVKGKLLSTASNLKIDTNGNVSIPGYLDTKWFTSTGGTIYSKGTGYREYFEIVDPDGGRVYWAPSTSPLYSPFGMKTSKNMNLTNDPKII